ncbi:unnamed protein product [Brachionus calyciflorus]|uniref:Transposase n=1 Tax=Brachionus calyciflorus TaxID=104777 RepID=A0A813YAD0_9BILA|nr:unnamed protein product [Brachionus calyciflorus]
MDSKDKLVTFHEISSTDQKERVLYLIKIGALFPERECDKCQTKCRLAKRKIVDEFSWRCSKCTKYYSIKHGSFFEQFNKTSILKVLEVIEYWSKGRKQCDMEQTLNISKPTSIRICKFLRQLCYLDLDKDNFRCGGPNQIVEIDESVFNKVKYNKGKDMVHKTKEKQLWVFGFKDRAKNKLNHSKEFIDKRTGCNTNSVESIWLKCKSKIRIMNGVSRLYLQEYLDEVMWRHNECRIANKDPKKELKYTRKVAFAKTINLINVNNMDKLNKRIEKVERKHETEAMKLKLQNKRLTFYRDEFVISHNRIINRQDLNYSNVDVFEINESEDEIEKDVNILEDEMLIYETVGQFLRSTQTDASSFNYKIKRKITEVKKESDKVFL